MKYIVMECHNGYAVLMDEEARFVKAADLHYEVGQSVTDPIILNEENRARKITFTAGKFMAAAACLVLFASAGMLYYSRNLKTNSVVAISTEADIRMEVNKKGRVIRLISYSESGKELLKNYSGKGKDKVTVANEIIDIELEKGYISSGDTIDFYISSDDSTGYEEFRSDLESSVSDVNVSIHGVDEKDKPAKPEKDTEKPDPPKPDKDNVPEKPAPDKEEPVQPPKPPEKHEQPDTDIPHAPKEKEKTEKPVPEHPPVADEPKAPEKPGDIKKPEPPAEHEKPAPPGGNEPPHHEHKSNEELSEEKEVNEQLTLERHRPMPLHPEPVKGPETPVGTP